jgi:poly(3-hydroxybutyrate) depolymerase
MAPMRAPAAVVAFALLAGSATLAAAKGGKPAPPPPAAWSEEDGRQVVRVEVGRGMKAYLQPPATPPEGERKAELIVILHGHGGTANGMLHFAALVAESRGAYVLACEGPGVERTDQGTGHSWDLGDAPAVVACAEAVAEKHPIDRKRVLLMGHSAGGTMSLAAWKSKPSAFAGVVTTASPAIPTSEHKGLRVAVVLGTKDGNFPQSKPAAAAADKTLVVRVLEVTDLPHELPHADYARECAAWVLDGKGPSDVLRVPLQPGDEANAPLDSAASKSKGKAFRHVLLFAAGGRGAPADAPSRADAKAKAAEVAARWKKAAAGADLGDEVATVSQDPLTKDVRGVVTGLVLARYGGALAAAMGKLKGGEASAPVESDAGWHVVARDRE